MKSLLSEAPASIISGLSLTNDNYLQAVELLTERYGNPQVLIHSQMDVLVQLQKLPEEYSANDFRKFFDCVEVAVRNLRSLKVDTLLMVHYWYPYYRTNCLHN